VALGKPDEATAVLEDALSKARSQQKRGHEAQVLILLGKLAAHTGERKQAIADLESAAQFSKQGQSFEWRRHVLLRAGIILSQKGPTTQPVPTYPPELDHTLPDKPRSFPQEE
jgi:hypothetical protein